MRVRKAAHFTEFSYYERNSRLACDHLGGAHAVDRVREHRVVRVDEAHDGAARREHVDLVGIERGAEGRAPSALDKRTPKMRASVSVGPPAANGTTMVMGRLG
jgi:hypothetical protein